MKTYSFVRVICPKCGKAYAIAKGATKAFHCPGRNCREMVNAAAASTGKQAEASSKAQS
jgi:ssDNA-binding Zn-finger/Zn-ribbon topoisomerase 1